MPDVGPGDYLRAIGGLAKRPGAGITLPAREVRRDAVRPDPARYADYVRLCGGALRDTVPAGWLHVLSFGLQTELMTARDFPVGVLGMVHVANEMSLLRPVSVGEPLAFSCRAENLRPHRRGALIDLVGEATVGDELVWTGRSAYLAQGVTLPGEPTRAQQEVDGLTEIARWRIGSDLGRRYAAVSGDHNPIHLSNLAAKAFGFPRAIAHGMWAQGRVLGALDGRLPDSYDVQIAFAKPILLGSTVTFSTGRDVQGGNARDGRALRYAVSSGERVHLTGAVRASSADACTGSTPPAR